MQMAHDTLIRSYSRPVKVYDLIVVTATMVFFVLCTTVLQVVVIAKVIVPTKEVVTELKIMRTERSVQDKETGQRLAEIESILHTNRARLETLQSLK